jgi:hypothetical protein
MSIPPTHAEAAGPMCQEKADAAGRRITTERAAQARRDYEIHEIDGWV